MKQPQSLLELASSSVVKNCGKGISATDVVWDLRSSLPYGLLQNVFKGIHAKQRAREMATRVIRQHFLEFFQDVRYEGRWRQYRPTGKNDKKCAQCLEEGIRRRFKMAPYNLLELIENKLCDLVMSGKFLTELEITAEKAVHRWLDRETFDRLCRYRRRRYLAGPFDFYDPFTDRYGCGKTPD